MKPHAPATLPLRYEPAGVHLTGGWIGPSAGLDLLEKRDITWPLPGMEYLCMCVRVYYDGGIQSVYDCIKTEKHNPFPVSPQQWPAVLSAMPT
jgi:hypothetical protein